MVSAVATNGRNGRRRKTYARIPDILPIPDLIKVQIESYEQFRATGLRELFDEISPIESFNGNLKLYFPGSDEDFNREWGLDYRFERPPIRRKSAASGIPPTRRPIRQGAAG